jgi:GxxExxY protein
MKDHEAARRQNGMLLARELTEQVIGLAIEVHRVTGPGMLESVYEGCLCHELTQAGIAFERQIGIPVIYKGGIRPATTTVRVD